MPKKRFDAEQKRLFYYAVGAIGCSVVDDICDRGVG